METTLSKAKSKEQLIKEVKERLDWYNFVASEEEFDENEVAALVELLRVLDTDVQVPDVDESYERFKQYVNQKSEDAERLEALRRSGVVAARSTQDTETVKIVKFAGTAENTDTLETMEDAGTAEFVETAQSDTSVVDRSNAVRDKAGDGKRDGKTRKGSVRHAYRYVAAAVLAAILLGGGAAGAVNAEKKGGIFQWLFKDDSGSVILVSPNENTIVDYTIADVFFSEEDVPEEYQDFLPNVDEIESLNEYVLKEIEIREMLQSVLLTYKLKYTGTDQEISLVCILHKTMMLYKYRFIDYEYIDSLILQEQEMEIYSKMDELGQTDYVVSFFHNNQQYYVQGKQSLEFLEQVALDYYDTLVQ